MDSTTSNHSEYIALIDLARSNGDLITKFISSLTETSTQNETASTAATPDLLSLIRDAATLLKAQTTKLSLLILTSPFTPSAVALVIREISSTCLPALMAAAGLCDPRKWGMLLSSEIKSGIARAVREMRALMQEVVLVASTEIGAFDDRASTETRTRGSLASTGVLWKACDDLRELESLGIVGVVVRKAEQYRATLKDAVEELKSWRDDESDEIDDALFSDGDSQHELVLAVENKCPKDDPTLLAQLEAALKRIRLIGTLYQAITKRRLRTFPLKVTDNESADGDAEVEKTRALPLERLNQMMQYMAEIPDLVDELAIAFYEVDNEQVEASLSACRDKCMSLVANAQMDWQGYDDEFAAWVEKWTEAFTK